MTPMPATEQVPPRVPPRGLLRANTSNIWQNPAHSNHGPRPTTPDRIGKVLTIVVERNLWFARITKSISAQILCVHLQQIAEMYMPVKNSVAGFSGGITQTALDACHIRPTKVNADSCTTCKGPQRFVAGHKAFGCLQQQTMQGGGRGCGWKRERERERERERIALIFENIETACFVKAGAFGLLWSFKDLGGPPRSLKVVFCEGPWGFWCPFGWMR